MRYEFDLGKLIASSNALDPDLSKKRHRSHDGAFFMAQAAIRQETATANGLSLNWS
ncbi:hypothetical protein [Agrobacterium sp. fls2-241-TYG-188a]|jgi:hypothetical protein|uniref:hypothetical protein n=1 Tax=Agrobacterium sp. fls2-241-TYG-188a TaxID=3040275 RepID=UPI000AF4789B|nr:hypothetical protein [Agrobacterium sp. fls2-241-TYG-188a]